MGTYDELKKIWKLLNIKGHVKNYSSQPLWVLETESGKPVAHHLSPMTKSPPAIDADAFRRKDGKPIEGHPSWWKIYDVANAELFDDANNGLRISAIAKAAVKDDEFARGGKIIYDEKDWGVPIRLLTAIRRNKKRRIVAYHVEGIGWLEPDQMLAMTCKHEVDNARPVFPKRRNPFVRTRRDQDLINNIEVMG